MAEIVSCGVLSISDVGDGPSPVFFLCERVSSVRHTGTNVSQGVTGLKRTRFASEARRAREYEIDLGRRVGGVLQSGFTGSRGHSMRAPQDRTGEESFSSACGTRMGSRSSTTAYFWRFGPKTPVMNLLKVNN